MKILLLSPHTDDVELGAGGSIIRFIEEKHKIFWIIFSSKNSLSKEFKNVISNLGLSEKEFIIYDYRIRYLYKHRQEILEKLVKIKSFFQPDLVLTPSLNDYHQDHQIVSNEVVRAFKTSCSILGYELPWNHLSFDSIFFIRLNKNHVEKKYDLLLNYKSQLMKKKCYFSRESVFGLAKVRGNQCNSVYAEAFEVIRWII